MAVHRPIQASLLLLLSLHSWWSSLCSLQLILPAQLFLVLPQPVSSWSIISSPTRRTNTNHHHHHHHHRTILPTAFSRQTPSVQQQQQQQQQYTFLLSSTTTTTNGDDDDKEESSSSSSIDDLVKAHVTSASGLSQDELSVVLEAIQHGYANGLGIAVDMTDLMTMPDDNKTKEKEEKELLTKRGDTQATTTTTTTTVIETINPIGALGRVLVLYTNLDDDTIEILQYAIAEEMDQRLYATPPLLGQPVLISIQNTSIDQPSDLKSIIENEVEQYGLIEAVGGGGGIDNHDDDNDNDDDNEHTLPHYQPPTLNVALDGATTTTDAFHQTTFWDTSNIVVFDNLVSDSLRERLLEVVLGGKLNAWDDATHGPNPNRWIRGGLSDIPDEEEEAEAEEGEEEESSQDTNSEDGGGSCWGLPEEAIDEICFQEHAAIQEFEEILAKVVFPQFIVTRLPEAVFGASVSPLTANAPTAGDKFDYHIDGDPNLTPPSPWTDVFGRYPNRLKGKPRFMSCVLYLNGSTSGGGGDKEEKGSGEDQRQGQEWQEEWGAPTRFLDPPTDETYDVIPKPGRFVLSDQDCRHTVVAPNESAGKRPRYSLVWKLVLHPKEPEQDMMDLAVGRDWPSPIVIGSAKAGAVGGE